MALINTEIKPFSATAFHNGEFVDVTDADLKGKWSVVFFYPADFTFVCPTELGDLADNYAEFKRLGVELVSIYDTVDGTFPTAEALGAYDPTITFTAGAAPAAPWSLAGPEPSPIVALWEWMVAWFDSSTVDEGCSMDPNGGCSSGENPDEGSQMDPDG